ncbi:H-NS histone [Pseudomonas sp. FSL R10-0399]|uniref:histone-like nucleoid-structuring protein MvaT n=1 Tax=Pseudomonas sp. FSL R10-0399 TaxID=2662194 RepID=UPI001296DE16|nr:histone-like nucleoid-structuring protein MvaT [Pseudomonas sp. FSL R10-0399]MQT57995.1 H-NS histone [Pseudomonas sp. FSL R10-0399]
MSLINQYRETEGAIKELQERLESLKNNEGLQKEMEFETKLRNLMGEYQKSLRDVTALLDPQSSYKPKANTVSNQSSGGVRRPRKVKTYKNPHSGEVIETKGGNHKTLKEWKAEHGSDLVESWATVSE